MDGDDVVVVFVAEKEVKKVSLGRCRWLYRAGRNRRILLVSLDGGVELALWNNGKEDVES